MTQLIGSGRDDVLAGTAGGDTIFGSGGSDKIEGGASGDALFGDGTGTRTADLGRAEIAEDVTAHVTFGNGSAGYYNAVGMYIVGADGSIHDVKILNNASALKLGKSGHSNVFSGAVDVALKAGEKLAFFVVPNGYNTSSANTSLLDSTSGRFELRDAKGNLATDATTGTVSLWHVSDKGVATAVKGAYGTDIFHSTNGSTFNSDHLVHATGKVDLAKGTIAYGFEDLKGGGDADFDDLFVKADIGVTNAALTPGMAVAKAGKTGNNDLIAAGDGDDRVFAMSGNDTVDGGAGNDSIWGAKGLDVLGGGDGDDRLFGNSDDDVMSGGAGNDMLDGGSGNDRLSGDAGDDVLKGGSGDDVLVASSGNDSYVGGKGFDTLDYSGDKGGVKVDLNAHTASGMGTDKMSGVEAVIGSAYGDQLAGDKRDNALSGGAGDDWLRGRGGSDVLTGGEGRDTFDWAKKDVGKSVDHITDFAVKEDVLDLHDLLKGLKPDAALDAVVVKDDGTDSHVYVDMGSGFREIAVLEGVSGFTAAELHDAGSLIL